MLYSGQLILMRALEKVNYYRRIFRAYLRPGQSHLNFWHDTAELNPHAPVNSLGEYYMTFARKAEFNGHYDAGGVPMLNYHGSIGSQYNPIAIAQWGLGNFNLFRRTGSSRSGRKFLLASDWLCNNLEPNSHRVPVWNHNFDWDYRQTLKAPWYSGLAQGQGISLLVRAHHETGDSRYMEAATLAFRSFLSSTDDGGVTFTDHHGNLWFEEYLVSPPTHILNGFMWAAWGVYDYFLATGSTEAIRLFANAVQTLRANLHRYDLGFWSLYEQSGMRLPMIASPFYHKLHITQLRVMHKITQEQVFMEYADRWESHSRSRSKRTRALCYKGAFKLCYY